jgi:hypothetical protein
MSNSTPRYEGSPTARSRIERTQRFPPAEVGLPFGSPSCSRLGLRGGGYVSVREVAPHCLCADGRESQGAYWHGRRRRMSPGSQCTGSAATVRGSSVDAAARSCVVAPPWRLRCSRRCCRPASPVARSGRSAHRPGRGGRR